MRPIALVALGVPLLLASVACRGTRPLTLPAPLSPPPSPPAEQRALRAGFGRADLTPPPGPGLQGYGPDGQVARGHRHRLYARALVLEDARGERIAFVTADLGQISSLLHREVAARLLDSTGIGADRLVLAATHSHSGPGHYLGVRGYDRLGAGVEGFDPAAVAFLAGRVAEAVRSAATRLRPAVAAWRRDAVWGLTRNRSLPPHRRNPPDRRPEGAPPGLSPELAAVDPTWTLLRVDTLTAAGDTVPAAALSIFAIHGTGNPAGNDLFDGDVQAIVERGLERHLDSLSGRGEEFAPRSLHLVASGAGGDVSPAWPPASRCPPPELRPGRRPAGPKTPPALDAWRPRPPPPASPCLVAARAYINALGDSLTRRAIAIFESARAGLTGEVTIARAFTTLHLTGPDAPAGLCPDPRAGSAMLGGAEDGRGVAHGWRLLGLVPLRAVEGESDPGRQDCQRPKREVHPIVRLTVGPLELPEAMDLAAVRVGEMALAIVPAEPTVAVGIGIRRAMLEAASRVGLEVAGAEVLALANGYHLYVATAEEYEVQHYEGAATLYGPATAAVLEAQLAALVDWLASGGAARASRLEARPGPARAVFPKARSAPRSPRLLRARCLTDTVVVRWLDARPGEILPAGGPLLLLRRTRAGEPDLSVWDDDRFLEVRGLGWRTGRGYVWEARWSPPGGVEGRYSFSLLPPAPPGSEWGFACGSP